MMDMILLVLLLSGGAEGAPPVWYPSGTGFHQALPLGTVHEHQYLTAAESAALAHLLAQEKPSADLDRIEGALLEANATLWDTEDEIRACERASDFGERFIELARSIYRQNDRRAALKRELNEHLGSALIEEKSYEAY